MPIALAFFPSSYLTHKNHKRKRTIIHFPQKTSLKPHNLNDALTNPVHVHKNVTLLVQSYEQQRNVENDSTYFTDVQLMEKSLFTWNSMISTYTKNELYYDAILMFCKLVCETELMPDNFTLPCVIKSCALLLSVGLGKTVHGLAVKLGLVFDVFVGNSLIMMYGKFELVWDGFRLFNSLPCRNLVSWNSMIRVCSENGFCEMGFDLFLQMLEDRECLIPDITTVVTLLPICSREKDIEMGMMIHGFAVKLGLSNEVNVNNALMDMYAKCECSFAARSLFERNINKNTVSWNSIIWNSSKEDDALMTFDLLRKMQINGGATKLNDVTILNVLPAFSKKSQVMSLKEIHSYSIRQGFFCGEFVANAFIVAYAKCESLISAYSIFRGLKTKTLNSWNAVINGYARYGDPGKAINLYLEMKLLGLNPDLFGLNSLILACSELRLLSSGKEIHGFVVRNGKGKDSFINVSLLSFYFRCDKPHYSKSIFDQIENTSLVSWNAMISGYCQMGSPVEALDIFRQMIVRGFKPDEITVTSLLSACSQLSCLRLGKEIHGFILRSHLTKDILISSSVIDMYAKCGCLELSRKFFDRLTLTEKDVAPWTVMISGYAYHGRANEALLIFEQLQR